jgi:hypothetical protein
VTAGLASQVSELLGGNAILLLQRMVTNILPISPLTAAGGAGVPPTAPPAADPGAVRCLCLLVWQLGSLAAHGQRLMLTLAVSAGLTARLWAAYLRPCLLRQHPATGAAPPPTPTAAAPPAPVPPASAAAPAAPAGTASLGGIWPACPDAAWEDPGWQLPLLVASQAFAAHIATADADGLHGPSAPLPLPEVWSEQQPRAGFLALLKAALWQVRVTGSAAGEGGLWQVETP